MCHRHSRGERMSRCLNRRQLLTPPRADTPTETAKAAAGVPEQAAKKPAVSDELTPTLTIRTGTQVVALDVVVTDSYGNQVRGLQPSDFSVSEDGKPQKVRYFRSLPTRSDQKGSLSFRREKLFRRMCFPTTRCRRKTRPSRW